MQQVGSFCYNTDPGHDVSAQRSMLDAIISLQRPDSFIWMSIANNLMLLDRQLPIAKLLLQHYAPPLLSSCPEYVSMLVMHPVEQHVAALIAFVHDAIMERHGEAVWFRLVNMPDDAGVYPVRKLHAARADSCLQVSAAGMIEASA